MTAELPDQDTRERIIDEFYARYRAGGLLATVRYDEVLTALGLDEPQGRRCFDYLRARGLIRPIARGGVYVPTVDLVDHVEHRQERKST